MGMTIEESIGWIKKTILDMRRTQICITDRLALETAVDTMRKYQKIEEIVNDRYGKPVFKTLDEVIKVVEDGKID